MTDPGKPSNFKKFCEVNTDALDYPDVPTGEGAYKIDDSIFDADTLEAMETARKAYEARKTK